MLTKGPKQDSLNRLRSPMFEVENVCFDNNCIIWELKMLMIGISYKSYQYRNTDCWANDTLWN